MGQSLTQLLVEIFKLFPAEKYLREHPKNMKTNYVKFFVKKLNIYIFEKTINCFFVKVAKFYGIRCKILWFILEVIFRIFLGIQNDHICKHKKPHKNLENNKQCDKFQKKNKLGNFHLKIYRFYFFLSQICLWKKSLLPDALKILTHVHPSSNISQKVIIT